MVGESLGGGVATWLAIKYPPRALVLASTFTSVPDLGAQIYPWLPVRLLARIEYDNLSRIGQIDAPVLIAHSRGDDIVPFAHGEALFAAAREPKQLLILARRPQRRLSVTCAMSGSRRSARFLRARRQASNKVW